MSFICKEEEELAFFLPRKPALAGFFKRKKTAA
jgi:hypothetical protein